MGKFIYRAPAKVGEAASEHVLSPPTVEEEYQGEYRDGIRDGQGVFHYSNGDSYSGTWLGGHKSGAGTYYYANDGGTLVGDWAGGKLIIGKWTLPDGRCFEGAFDENVPTGTGTWVSGGCSVNGHYAKLGNDSELKWISAGH